MYHFQKCWGFAVFCEFNTCHKEITIDSLFGSPCSASKNKNDTNMIRTNICIGKHWNIF